MKKEVIRTRTILAVEFLDMVEKTMKLTEMRYASPKDLARKLAELYGGRETAYLARIYKMRLKLDKYRE